MKRNKIIKTRKIYRIRHMKHMLSLAKRARRVMGNVPDGQIERHIANYETLLQLVQDLPE